MKTSILGIVWVALLALVPVSTQAADTTPTAGEATQIVTEAEMKALEASLDGMGNETEQAEYFGGAWKCISRSWVTGLTYFWVSPNLAFARYRALGACQYVNGFTCAVTCGVVY